MDSRCLVVSSYSCLSETKIAVVIIKTNLMEPVFLIFLISIVVFSLIKLGRIGRRPKGCPPGPPTLPILGNLHQIPKKDAHVQFKKWAEEYGPVYSLVLGTTVNIVLSSDVAVKDLLDKRSGIYSSRPEAYISSLASDGRRMVLMVRNSQRSLIDEVTNRKSGVWEQMAPYPQILSCFFAAQGSQGVCSVHRTRERVYHG